MLCPGIYLSKYSIYQPRRATQHGNVQIRSFVATLHIDMGCPGPIAAPLSMEVFLVSVEHGGTSEQWDWPWDCMGHEDIKSLKFDKKISRSRHTLQKLWTSLDSGHMAWWDVSWCLLWIRTGLGNKHFRLRSSWSADPLRRCRGQRSHISGSRDKRFHPRRGLKRTTTVLLFQRFDHTSWYVAASKSRYSYVLFGFFLAKNWKIQNSP